MKRLRQFALVGCMLAALIVPSAAAAAHAQTLYVNGDPASGHGQSCNGADFSTIQDAIDAASPGDTVVVCDGTYAGAVVDKAVNLVARGQVVIDSGPYVVPGMYQGGFLFNPDRSGSGASIEGFQFVGTTQFSAPDDGKLDFGIFSRGADDVVVAHNTLTDTLQAISDNDGTNWTIEHNTVTNLWTSCGGGIGIIVLGRDGHTVVAGNVVSHNVVQGTLEVDPNDCGGYTGVGLNFYVDFRSRPGVPAMTNNVIEHNTVSLVSDTPGLVNANGIEVTADGAVPPSPVIHDNRVSKNDVYDMSGNGIVVSDGTANNTFDKNHYRDDVETDAVDQSIGTGTAGTANTWTGNHCDTGDPAGLCEQHPQHPVTFYVNDDEASGNGQQCQNADFSVIQDAVDAASAGDTIVVCDGTYTEQVTMDKSLALVAQGDATIKAPAVMDTSKTIVRVSGAATDASITGFTISGPGSGGCDSLEFGVRVDSGAHADISQNHVTMIEDAPFSGCQNGVAIQVGRAADATTGSATITDNVIDNYQKNGITVDGAGSSAEIARNTVTGAGSTPVIGQNGVQISRSATASVHHNQVSDNRYAPSTGDATPESTGVLLFLAGATTVDHNAVDANDVDIYVIQTSNAVVEHNVASDATFHGVYLENSSGNTVSDNQVSASNDQASATDDVADAKDNSVGTGTAGTANTWTGNHCDTSDPDGLCH